MTLKHGHVAMAVTASTLQVKSATTQHTDIHIAQHNCNLKFREGVEKMSKCLLRAQLRIKPDILLLGCCCVCCIRVVLDVNKIKDRAKQKGLVT